MRVGPLSFDEIMDRDNPRTPPSGAPAPASTPAAGNAPQDGPEGPQAAFRAALARERGRAASRALPADFRPHVETGEHGGVAATGLVERGSIRSDADLLTAAGLDPDHWELAPGTKRVWCHADRPGEVSIFFAFEEREQDDAVARWLASRFEPPAPAAHTDAPGAPLFIALADLQIGKSDERLGGTPELVARCRSVLSQLQAICREERPSEIVLADLGDICENTASHTHGSQAASNDIPVAEQVRVAARILMAFTVALRPLCDRLTVAGVRSNHGEERLPDGKVNRSGDWGIAVVSLLSDTWELLAPSGPRPDFIVQDALEPGVRVDLGPLPIGLTHGHYAKRVQRMPDWVAQQCGGMRPSVFDGCPVIVHGHFHHLTVQSSRGRLILGCPAMESGSDWVAKASGEWSDPGVLTFRERGGRLADLRILTPSEGMEADPPATL